MIGHFDRAILCVCCIENCSIEISNRYCCHWMSVRIWPDASREIIDLFPQTMEYEFSPQIIIKVKLTSSPSHNSQACSYWRFFGR